MLRLLPDGRFMLPVGSFFLHGVMSGGLILHILNILSFFQRLLDECTSRGFLHIMFQLVDIILDLLTAVFWRVHAVWTLLGILTFLCEICHSCLHSFTCPSLSPCRALTLNGCPWKLLFWFVACWLLLLRNESVSLPDDWKCYVDSTAQFRQSDQLFVCYGGVKKGAPVLKQRLWITG